MRVAPLALLVSCAHAPAVLPRAHAPIAPVVVAADPEVDDPALYKLPEYHPMQSFLEKTSPDRGGENVYITLTETEGPMSLERRPIETAAHDCFLDSERKASDAAVTVTLETRADGNIADASVDGATLPFGQCFVARLAHVALHEEGKPQHIVVALAASFTSNSW